MSNEKGMPEASTASGPEKETTITNTTSNVIKVSESLNNQRILLKKLQSLPGSKPILVKCLEGSIPAGADPDLYLWKYWKDVIHKASNPIYTRATLSFEIVVDFDVDDWNLIKQEGDKLITFLKSANIPYLLAYSGGDGIHVHIFSKPLEFNLSDLKEYDVDVAKAVRSSVCYAFLQDANVKPADIGLDKKKINFNKGGKGSQIREFGTIRPDGRYKTLINEIPAEKPEISPSLIFPADVIQWDITATKYYDVAREAVISAIEKAKKDNEYVLHDADFADTNPLQYPCINTLMQKGIPAGRYYGGQAVMLMSKKCGLTKEEALRNTRQFLERCSGLGAADVDLRIKNVLSMWDQDYNFSCAAVKDYIDPTLCKFRECPICAKLEEKKRNVEDEGLREITEEEIKKEHDEYLNNKYVPDLPEGHFIKDVMEWIESLTDGYQEYAMMGALWLLSAIVGRHVVLDLKAKELHANLWIFIIGRSTISRKSVVVDKLKSIFELITDTRIYSDEFSKDGLLETLAINPIKHVVKDEAAGLLSKMQKQYNDGIFDFECELYDGGNVCKTLSAKKKGAEPTIYSINNPYFTQFLATTPARIGEALNLIDFRGGWGFRFLFAHPTYHKTRKPHELKTNEDVDSWASIIARSKKLFKLFNSDDTIKFTADNETMKYYDKINEKAEEQADSSTNEDVSSYTGRLMDNILKVAMLYEIGKKEPNYTLTNEGITFAANLILNYCQQCGLNIIELLEDDIKRNQVEKVESTLRKRGGLCSHTELLQATHLKSKEFKECIDTLLESQTIDVVLLAGTKKRHYKMLKTKVNRTNKTNKTNTLTHKDKSSVSFVSGNENINNVSVKQVHKCALYSDSVCYPVSFVSFVSSASFEAVQNYANTWQTSNGPVNSSNIDTFVMNFILDQAKAGQQHNKEEVKAAAEKIFKIVPKQETQIVNTAEDTAKMINELQAVV